MTQAIPLSAAEVRTLCSVLDLPPAGGVFEQDYILLGCRPTEKSRAIRAAYRRGLLDASPAGCGVARYSMNKAGFAALAAAGVVVARKIPPATPRCGIFASLRRCLGITPA